MRSWAIWKSFSSAASSPALKNVPARHRAATWRHARIALTEYLHVTRSLQYSHAENIAAHSPSSLSSLLSRFPFPARPSLLHSALRRFLSFRPVNEFDFFFESIGLRPPPLRRVFLSDDAPLVPAVTALVLFGFPWTRLGLLYSASPSLFSLPPHRISDLLLSFQSLAFDRVVVVGFCLAFPSLLSAQNHDLISAQNHDLISAMIDDLKLLFSDFYPEGSAEENVEVCFRLCRRLRTFYRFGSRKGTLGELLRSRRDLLLEIEDEDLNSKLDFFCRLGMSGEEAGSILLNRPELLRIDLESRSLRMPDFLRGIGFGDEDLESVSVKFPFAMGENRIGNLPAVLRAVDLSEIFVRKIKMDGEHRILCVDDGLASADEDFSEELASLMRSSKGNLAAKKLEFLLGIGFGKNKITLKTLRHLNSSKDQLRERFDCLISLGLDHSKVCRMVSATPKLLNQNAEMLIAKIEHLRSDLGCSLDYLNNFPAYLCFDLENRVKPRYRILNWLREAGLLKKNFAPATVLATSEKKFIACLLDIHPAVPKLWFEIFSSKNNRGNINK
ncbi:mitochondrial transcription termination factor family protein [Wolffia australiana]